MNIFKLSVLSSALVFSQGAFANQYEEDEQNFYVDGQSINDALGDRQRDYLLDVCDAA